ncbi:hypothetical protein D3C76_1830300 [compost metagenome]
MVEERQAFYPAGRQRKWPLWRYMKYINQRYALLAAAFNQPRQRLLEGGEILLLPEWTMLK